MPKHVYDYASSRAERVADEVVESAATRKGSARSTSLPGAVVLERYAGGQPRLYEYNGQQLTTRQYWAICKELNRLGSKADVGKVINGVVNGQGKRQTGVPGAEVIDYYPTGQAKTYRYRGRILSRRQYMQTLKVLRERGVLVPRSKE